MRTSRFSQIFLKVAGSLLATLAGALAGVSLMLLLGWEDWRVCLMMIGFFAIPAWALVLLPLHVLLPRSSPFWKPGASAGVGAAAGVALLTIYFLFEGLELLWIFLPTGVVVGIVAGLVGSGFPRFYAARSA